VYFADLNSCDAQNGFVARVAKNGGAITKIVEHQDAPVALVVDSTHVYWVNQGYGSPRGAVWKARKDGSAPAQQLASGLFQTAALAIDAAFFYAGASDDASGAGTYVAREAFGSSAADHLATAGQALALVSDGESVFAGVSSGTSAQFLRFRVGAATSETIIAGLTGIPYDLKLDEYYLYFVDSSAAGTVQRAKKDGTLRLTYANEKEPMAIAIDDASVYWLNHDGEVKRVPKSGGTAVTLGKDPLGNNGKGLVHSLAVDGAHVYWAGSGRIYRVSKLGP
jgi:hypothetical protein